MAMGNSGSGDTAFHRALERIVFGHRAIVLVLFALVTLAMGFFASQLRVDAGFMKQIPRDHPYMATFTEYMAEFGGANRVLVALVAKDGDIFDQAYMARLDGPTKDVMAMGSRRTPALSRSSRTVSPAATSSRTPSPLRSRASRPRRRTSRGSAATSSRPTSLAASSPATGRRPWCGPN